MGSGVISALPALEALTCLLTPLLLLTHSLRLQKARGAQAFSPSAHSGGGTVWPVAEFKGTAVDGPWPMTSQPSACI